MLYSTTQCGNPSPFSGIKSPYDNLQYVNVTWDKSAFVAVQVCVSFGCVENGGVTVARDLLEKNETQRNSSCNN